MANQKMHHGFDMQSNIITGLPAPSNNSDAATKEYVDANAGGALTATDVSFTPEANTFPNTVDTVDEALKHLFTSANSGKNDVADSIGYATPYSDTFASLATNIDTAMDKLESFLPKAEKTLVGNEKLHELANLLGDVRVLKKVLKLNRNAGTSYSLTLRTLNGSRPPLNALCILPYVRINDTATTSVKCEFNNGVGESFINNPYIEFVNSGGNTYAQIKKAYTFSSSVSSSVYSYTFDFSNFSSWTSFVFSVDDLTFNALPVAQLMVADGDISLTNVNDITSVVLSGTLLVNSQPVYIAVSMNGGSTWYYHNGITWITDSIANASSFTGMTSAVMNALGIQQWTELRTLNNESETIRFAYKWVDTSLSDWISIDKLTMGLVLSGSFVPVTHTTSTGGVQTSYNAASGSVTFTFTASDSYQIHYLDTVEL